MTSADDDPKRRRLKSVPSVNFLFLENIKDHCVSAYAQRTESDGCYATSFHKTVVLLEKYDNRVSTRVRVMKLNTRRIKRTTKRAETAPHVRIFREVQ